MKKFILFSVIFIFIIAACQPSTFVISKGTRAYYFGRESKGLYRLLCETGDLKKVLRDSDIPVYLKEDFYRYICTDHRSEEKVISLYQFLTPEERRSLKRAFIKHGYTVNYVPC